MSKKFIDTMMEEVMVGCDHLLTCDQLKVIRESMINYGAAAVMDSSVRNEIFNEDEAEKK